MTDNHFISVSKKGVLMARRKGCAPVEVASAAEGLSIETDERVADDVRVFFGPGGAERSVFVTSVRIGSEHLEPSVFLDRFGVSEDELGKWMRAAVEAALDAAIDRS